MNILPKKRWHVRTKENIARVRKDEAEAAEKERQEQSRIENADREARLNILKNKSKEKLLESGIVSIHESHPDNDQQGPNAHINLFSDLEHAITTTNKDHDQEAKEKKEEYEKKIGYLTYLGQDTNEALGKKNWYETLPEASRFSRSSDIKDTYDKLVLKDPDGKPKTKDLDVKDGEVAWKAKQRLDPINAFRKHCYHDTKGNNYRNEAKSDQLLSGLEFKKDCKAKQNKHKSKNRKHSKEKDREDCKRMKLQKLREARVKREQQEKCRTEMFLAGLNGSTSSNKDPVTSPKVKPKYNSQFNPELARQNFTNH